MNNNSKVVDKIISRIDESIGRLINKNIEYTLSIIQKRVIKIQNTFYNNLVNYRSGIIGTSSTPSLKNDNLKLTFPKWQPLSGEYNLSKKNNYRDRFFINNGNLKKDLINFNTNRQFGTPEIIFQQKGANGKDRFFNSKKRGGFSISGPNKTFIKNNGIIGTIDIDLFPNIKGTFKSDYDLTWFQNYFKDSKKTAFKLHNSENNKRPFIGQYMEWWVKVKAKQSILKGVV